MKPNAASSNEAIKAWILAHWRDDLWGLMDCDRCAFSSGGKPCDACPRWTEWIMDFRRTNPAPKRAARPMTKTEYRAAMKRLGLPIYRAGPAFGFTPRQSQKYAAGDAPVPRLLAKVIGLVLAGKLTLEDLK